MTTELALKGMDVTVSIDLSRQKDGAVESLGSAEDEDVEMYACDACNGLVKATDPSCPHCGAIFDDGEEEQQPTEQEAPPQGTAGRTESRAAGGPSKGPPGGRVEDRRGTKQGHREVRVEDRQGDRARDHQEDRVEDRQVDRARTAGRTESRATKWTEQGTARRTESRTAKWTEQGTRVLLVQGLYDNTNLSRT